MTSDNGRIKYASALHDLTEAFWELRTAASRLPTIPDTGCTCGGGNPAQDLRLEELGYGRWTVLLRHDNHWIANTDGWDDMSESGTGPQVVYCFNCETYWNQPKEMDWT